MIGRISIHITSDVSYISETIKNLSSTHSIWIDELVEATTTLLNRFYIWEEAQPIDVLETCQVCYSTTYSVLIEATESNCGWPSQPPIYPVYRLIQDWIFHMIYGTIYIHICIIPENGFWTKRQPDTGGHTITGVHLYKFEKWHHRRQMGLNSKRWPTRVLYQLLRQDGAVLVVKWLYYMYVSIPHFRNITVQKKLNWKSLRSLMEEDPIFTMFAKSLSYSRLFYRCTAKKPNQISLLINEK